jgi:hypothetical protein
MVCATPSAELDLAISIRLPGLLKARGKLGSRQRKEPAQGIEATTQLAFKEHSSEVRHSIGRFQ